MENIYCVAIHYNEDIGYVEYNEADKKAKVVLKNRDKKEEVEQFLAKEHEIKIPNKTLMDFSDTKVKALDSLESFKLAMTRLWGKTGVYVDWSRPVITDEI